jgi:hypothetical protein
MFQLPPIQAVVAVVLGRLSEAQHRAVLVLPVRETRVAT